MQGGDAILHHKGELHLAQIHVSIDHQRAAGAAVAPPVLIGKHPHNPGDSEGEGKRHKSSYIHVVLSLRAWARV